MKKKTVFVCSLCGTVSPKWNGKCPECGQWNTFEETEIAEEEKAPKKQYRTSEKAAVLSVSEVSDEDSDRISTGICEFDRVLGGGLVKGSLCLIGGEPGIGKSTVILQACANIADNSKVLYCSGEESPSQIKRRAKRLDIETGRLFLSSETNIKNVVATAEKMQPSVVVIDSIQTMYHPEVSSSAGTVSQIRECTQHILRYAKSASVSVFLIGHVTKEGNIAGPKILEHMVDTVLYIEGERNLALRVIRCYKNRFGATSELGMFEMTGTGMEEVANPSVALISQRPKNVSGSVLTCVQEGLRPILVEIQSLVIGGSYGAPRRTAAGVDYSRMAMLIAVLEKRAGVVFSNSDVYANVTGGLRLDDPATDLALLLAMYSARSDIVIKEDIVALGEVGLGGEVRSVPGIEERVRECVGLGFKYFIIPRSSKFREKAPEGAEIYRVADIRESLDVVK